MDVLVLHNNNLPVEIVDRCADGGLHCTYTSLVMQPSLTDVRTFDQFVSDEMASIFSKRTYNLIVLPYNIIGENYAEYSGVRLGLHLRLAENTKSIPLLFIGKDKVSDVAKLSELGSLLFTPLVFTSECSDIVQLDGFINDVIRPIVENRTVSDHREDYRKFLNRIKIQDIENFGPHAISNVWALKRWSDLLDIKNIGDGRYLEFLSQLNFKYLDKLAQIDAKREDIKKKKTVNPTIPLIDSKKIVYIDDELKLGWGDLFSEIFSRSSAHLICWNPVDKTSDRKAVLDDIEAFIDHNSDADCYIVDLRLAEEDTTERNFENLTGHKVSRYIRSKNKANQVVIFTASNKIWNLKEELNEIGALGYVLKESPSMNMTVSQTTMLHDEFVRLIQKAVVLSRLKELVEFQNRMDTFMKSCPDEELVFECSSIYNSIDLLLSDRHLFDFGEDHLGRSPQSGGIIKSVILSQFVFVEEFCKNRYDMTPGDMTPGKTDSDRRWIVDEVVRKDGKFKPGHSKGHIFVAREYDENRHSQIVDVKITSEKLESPESCWAYLSDKKLDSALSIILSSLYCFNDIDSLDAKLILKYKDLRNQIAHQTGSVEISYCELCKFYKLISIMLRTEYPDLWKK